MASQPPDSIAPPGSSAPTPPMPREDRPGRGARWLRFTLIAAAALLLAHLLDRAAYTLLYDPHVYDHDWGRMLRSLGFLPVWMIGALALALAGPQEPEAVKAARRRGLLLFLGPTASGIAGELLKLVIRRERPWAEHGAYVFRPWSVRPLSSAGLSMPSSHSTVAFGAAFVLARLYPRTAFIWIALAVGCSLTRVAARAHFLSDVTLGAIVSFAVVAGLWRWLGPAGQSGR